MKLRIKEITHKGGNLSFVVEWRIWPFGWFAVKEFGMIEDARRYLLRNQVVSERIVK